MDVLVRGTNCDVSDQELVRTKLQRLARVAGEAARAEVEFTAEHPRHAPTSTTCEVTVHLRKGVVRAHAAASDDLSALDQVVDKLEHQLARRKDRRLTKMRGRHAQAPSIGDPDEVDRHDRVDGLDGLDDDDVDDDGPRIVRVDHDLKPMSPEEAALQLEALGVEFLVFSNSENERAAVLYRRRDGDLGLIEIGR
jgi:putative sigma-54 modulation protein